MKIEFTLGGRVDDIANHDVRMRHVSITLLLVALTPVQSQRH